MKSVCLYCKKEFIRPKSSIGKFCSSICYWESLKGRSFKHTEETKQKISKHHNPASTTIGEQRYNWAGGSNSHAIKRAINRIGLKYECIRCGKNEGKIDIHHIDKDRTNNKAPNILILCSSCHAKLHHVNGDMMPRVA